MAFLYKIKEKFKKALRKILKFRISKDSYLFTRSITSSQIYCQWELSKKHKKQFLSNKDHYLSIRIYDITNSKSNDYKTCIMKEVKVNKHSKDFTLNTLVSNGILLLEVGYREPYGKWFLLASSLVTLGSRTNPSSYLDDSWFYLPQGSIQIDNDSVHDKVYQLAKSGFDGGSEVINK